MKNMYRGLGLYHTARCYKLLYVVLVFCWLPFAGAQVTYQWSAGIGGTFDDEGLSTTVDNAGNIYMTGNFLDIVDFDPSGNVANLNCIAAPDVFLAKYDAAGNYLWAFNLGYFTPAYGEAVTTDIAGNVYITGYFMDSLDLDPSPAVANVYSNGIFDVFVAKYDASGNYIWGISFGGPTVDFGYSLAVDNLQNVYVTGYFLVMADFDPSPNNATLFTTSGSPDIFLAKYDINGNYMWAQGIGGPSFDQGNHIVLDASANIYMTGYFQDVADFDPSGNVATLTSGSASYDVFIAKYDSAGNYIWAKGMGGDYEDKGNALALDGTGNIYVTGQFQWIADFDPSGNTANLTAIAVTDMFLAKYDPAGNYVWAKNIGGASHNQGHGIALDQNANIYFTGFFQGTADFDPSPAIDTLSSQGAQDIFLASFDSAGNYLWARNFGGTADDMGHAVTMDSSGDIILTGFFQATADFDPTPDTADHISNGGKDIFLARYGLCGNLSNSITATICVGNIYPFGSQMLTASGTYTEIFAGQSGCDSVVTLTLTVDSADNSVAVNGTIITANTSGALYQWINCNTQTPISGETGQSFTATANGLYAVIVTENGCSDTSACTQISGLSVPNEIPNATLNIYPNPSSGDFQVNVDQSLDIRITDVSGKIVHTQTLFPGASILDLRHLQAGVYFIGSDLIKQQVKALIIK